MKKTKTTFKNYSIYQYREEEAYLSSMHEAGWKFTGITFPGFYHFTACEPEKVTYRLDYNKDGLKEKGEYDQLFADCGWEHFYDFAGYSYFRKAGESNREEEEIFSDDASRLEMMKRVCRGRIIPMIVILLFAILPQFFLLNIAFDGRGIFQRVLPIFFLGLAFLYLLVFTITAFWIWKFEKKIADEHKVGGKYLGIAGLLVALTLLVGAFTWQNRRSIYEIVETGKGYTIEAQQLNSEVVTEYDLKKGDQIAMSLTLDSGKIHMSIGVADESPVFFGDLYKSMDDLGTVEVPEDGHYRILVSGVHAKGSIGFEFCVRIESKTEEASFYTGDSGVFLVYVDEFDGKELVFDQIEWVEVPGERATELGFTEEDSPNGFCIYNEAVRSEKLPLAQNCVCTILDWTAGYVQKAVTTEELRTVLVEREGTYIPYLLTIENNEITEIMEHYVP